MFHLIDIFPEAFFTIDITSCTFIISAKFFCEKLSLRRQVMFVFLSFCRKQLNRETEKYSTNHYLMPEYFDILFTFNSST